MVYQTPQTSYNEPVTVGLGGPEFCIGVIVFFVGFHIFP